MNWDMLAIGHRVNGAITSATRHPASDAKISRINSSTRGVLTCWLCESGLKETRRTIELAQRQLSLSLYCELAATPAEHRTYEQAKLFERLQRRLGTGQS